jgi:dihydroxyacid dehydratase/phosphogluconate dehydratase
MEDLYYCRWFACSDERNGMPSFTMHALCEWQNNGAELCHSQMHVAIVMSSARWNCHFKPESGIVVVKGNLAPHGAVINLLQLRIFVEAFRQRQVVFENIEDYHAHIR